MGWQDAPVVEDKPADASGAPKWASAPVVDQKQEDQPKRKSPLSWYQDIPAMIPSIIPRAAAGMGGLVDAISNNTNPKFQGGEDARAYNTEQARMDAYFKAHPEAVSKNPAKPPDTALLSSDLKSTIGPAIASGWKNIMGNAYHEPETTPGKVADFALQTAMFGVKSPKDILSTNTLKNLASGTAAGTAGELVPDDYPKLKIAAQIIGGMTPTAVEAALKSPDRATRNAASVLKKAMDSTTAKQWEDAQKLINASHDVGVPLTGPEAFPGGHQVQQTASDVAASPNSGAKIRNFMAQRPQQVETATKNALKGMGENVGGQEAANQAQNAADKVISNAQEARTKAASPKYQYQKASDKEALTLMDQIKATQKDIKSGQAWKNDAVQQAGKWYQYSHQMGLKANDIAKKTVEWAGTDAEREAAATHVGEGGKPDPNVAKVEGYMDRANEAKEATYDAVKEARNRQNYLDQWKKEADQKADKLAQKDLPEISKKVRGFLSNLDADIRLANPNTTEGKILREYRNEIAPNGEPLRLPSQLESAYKAIRDRTNLGLNPTSLERTTAGVLKPYVSKLDELIQGVSPAIKEGREIYKKMSQEVVDPLFKGPIGKLAGKGADAQMEASYSRMISEMNGKTATPKRIEEIADRLKTVDKEAFPNMTRAYLEDELDASLKDLQGRRNPMSGANFRNAIAGTPKQRDNLKAMIMKTAEAQGQGGATVWGGFNKLLDVLDATGRVPGMGSQTHSRGQLEKALNVSPTAGAVEGVNPLHTTSVLGDKIREMVNHAGYKKLAEVFTAPDSIAQMKKLAMMKSNSDAAKELVLKMLESGKPAAKVSATKGANSHAGGNDDREGGGDEE